MTIGIDLAHQHLALLAETVPAPGRIKTLCPFCNGGQSREVSFSFRVNADGSWYGRCYRASCEAAAWSKSWPWNCTTTESNMHGPELALTEPDTLIPESGDWYRICAQRFDRWAGLPLLPAYIRKCMADAGFSVLVDNPGTLVTALVGFKGERLGYQTRTLGKTCRTYKAPGVETAYYFNLMHSLLECPLFIVEDAMSAYALSRRAAPAVALLGTTISDSLARQVSKRGYNSVVVALDPGAERSGATVAAKLREHGVKAVCWPLRRDIKDMRAEELSDLVGVFKR